MKEPGAYGFKWYVMTNKRGEDTHFRGTRDKKSIWRRIGTKTQEWSPLYGYIRNKEGWTRVGMPGNKTVIFLTSSEWNHYKPVEETTPCTNRILDPEGRKLFTLSNGDESVNHDSGEGARHGESANYSANDNCSERRGGTSNGSVSETHDDEPSSQNSNGQKTDRCGDTCLDLYHDLASYMPALDILP